MINTDNGPIETLDRLRPYRVLAIDGYDVHEPDPVVDSRSRSPPAVGSTSA